MIVFLIGLLAIALREAKRRSAYERVRYGALWVQYTHFLLAHQYIGFPDQYYLATFV